MAPIFIDRPQLPNGPCLNMIKNRPQLVQLIVRPVLELFDKVNDMSHRWNHPRKTADISHELLPVSSVNGDQQRAYIGGVGDSAIKSALLAIAKAAGGKNIQLVSM
ncbi:MAG: hypothetical protein IPG22_06185 [Acidobacteria bacterium]|nr:hypothetical protein [Acidobacteriota bacterium]